MFPSSHSAFATTQQDNSKCSFTKQKNVLKSCPCSTSSLSTISPTSLVLSQMKFYKIIRSPNVEKSKLKLPGKFETRFKDKLPKHVTLDVPSGAKWRVEVEKKHDGVWLMGQGWIEFVDSLVLRKGHFLMFEFDELIDVFHVVVMGMNASEVKYPVLAIDECLVDVLGDDDTNDKEDDDTELRNRTHKPDRKKGYNRVKRETVLDKEGRIRCVIQGRISYDITDGAEQALARAKAFKATEPVFIVILKRSYLSRKADLSINKRSQLLVPRSFIVAFDLAVKNVILETCDGKTWPVLCRQSGKNYHFTVGWLKFAEDNSLVTGDVCLFELNIEAQNALRVGIFRTTGDDQLPISSSLVKSTRVVSES